MKYPVEIEFKECDYRLFDAGKNFVCKTDSEENAVAIRDALNAMIRHPEEPEPEWPKCFKLKYKRQKIGRYLVYFSDNSLGVYFNENGENSFMKSELGFHIIDNWDIWQPCPLPPEIIGHNPQLFGVKSVKDSMKPGESYERDGVTVGVTQPTSEPEPEERFYRWSNPINAGETAWQWMGFRENEMTCYDCNGAIISTNNGWTSTTPWKESRCKEEPGLAILEPTIPEPIRLQREKSASQDISGIVVADFTDFTPTASPDAGLTTPSPVITVEEDLTKMELEQLKQLHKATWDGNLLSKLDRTSLIDKGYAYKVGGWNLITKKGAKWLDHIYPHASDTLGISDKEAREKRESISGADLTSGYAHADSQDTGLADLHYWRDKFNNRDTRCNELESDNAKLRDDYKVAKIYHAKMQNLYIKMQNALSAAQAEKIELDGMFATLETENAELKRNKYESEKEKENEPVKEVETVSNGE